MSEIKPNLDYNIDNLQKFKKIEEILVNKKDEEEQLYESGKSSTSASSINESNDNLGIKSNFLLKNLDVIGQNQRKFSAPVSCSENFVLNFIKFGGETRGSYFNKLIINGLLTSSENKNKFKYNSIFILDWDDTLLCTTVLSPCGYFDDNMIILPSKMEKIKKLEILVKKLLTITTEKGDTYIITNSEPGWVEYSCKRFFPNAFVLLDKIKIISARGIYEKKYPKDFKAWKLMTFNDIIKNYEKNLPTNIMCLGDSSYEIEAAYGLASKFPNGFVKAIKFKEFPKIDELISQLNLILGKFNFIYSACKNWNITIDKKKKENTSK